MDDESAPPPPPASDPPADGAAPPPDGPPPPRNLSLLRATWLWTAAAVAWTSLTTLVVLNSELALRWLLFSGHARYVVFGAVGSMLLWSVVRRYATERIARLYLAVIATLFGVFGALLVFALKLVPLLTIVALALFSLGAMTVVGLLSPFNLRRPRQALEIVRQIAELTLAGVTLGPELGWFETAAVSLGLAAALGIVGDDTQTLANESHKVDEADVQRVATTHAVDQYLSFFRLTLIFMQLLRGRGKKKPRPRD